MARIVVDANTDATGTTNDDLFIIENATSTDVTIDALSGSDEAQIFDGGDLLFADAGELNGSSANGVYTVQVDENSDGSGNDIVLENFELFTFRNGQLTSTAAPGALQYLQTEDVTVDAHLTSANRVSNAFATQGAFVWDGVDLNLDTDFVATAINGMSFVNGVVDVDGLGAVFRDNNNDLDLLANGSAFNGLSWGEERDSSIVVTYTDNGVSFDEVFTFTLEGSATTGNDFYSTNAKDGDQDTPLDGLAGDDFVSGDEGDDIIYGNDGNDEIFAGSNDDGDDAFAGGAGNDIIGGGEGDDFLIGDDSDFVSGAVNASFDSSADGNDLIFGGAGDDVIYTGSYDGSHTGNGSDIAYAGEGDDVVYGDDGDDILGGGQGRDFIEAGNGNDIIYGGNQDDHGSGGFFQFLDGGNGNDLMFGGATANEVVLGGNGNDIIYNGAGDDQDIFGNDGNDTLWGGAGDDELSGGNGTDVFAFVAGNGDDTITDFQDGTDLLDLSNVDGFDSDNLVTATQGGNTVLFYGDNDTITFNGTVSLDSSDFTDTAMSDFG